MKKEARHGLATMLRCMKHHPSPIDALTRIGHTPTWNKFRPSEHIDRFCCRVLRGRPNATFEDWNQIVNVIQSRDYGMRSSPSIKRSVIRDSKEKIVAWYVDRDTPIGEEMAGFMSKDPSKEKAEMLKNMMDRAIQEAGAGYKQKVLKNGTLSKRQLEYFPGVDFSYVCLCPGCGKLKLERRLSYWVGNIGKVCIGCSNKYRAFKNGIDRAEQGLKELKNEVKQINKMVKDLKNGTQ